MIRAGAVTGLLLVVSSACATPARAPDIGVTASPPVPKTSVPPVRMTRDSVASSELPIGFGTLRQEDIAIVLQPNGVRVEAIPLDESVIRTLAPDSYRNLRAVLESRRQQILQRASIHGVREPRVWIASFTGLTPDARFIPTDFTVSSGGRDYRPIDIIPLTSGFGEQRVQPRQTQRALLLFDEAVDVSQPIVVAMGSERNTDWSNDRSDTILSKIEAERAQIRARAGGRP